MSGQNSSRSMPACPGPAVVQAGPAPEEATVSFTVLTGSKPLTKAFAVGEDGRPVKSRDAGLSEGSAARVVLQGTATAILQKLAQHLEGLTANQALVLAPPPSGKDEWPLVLKQQAEGRNDVIARTKQHFRPASGPTLLALDFDAKEYPETIVAELRKCYRDRNMVPQALADAFPGFEAAGTLSRASSSAGVRNRDNGKTAAERPGQHRYYVSLDGADAEDFAQRLHDRLILGGWGWGKLTDAGIVVCRTLFDVAASTDLSRLWYEADAVLDDPRLEQVARTPKVESGGFLNTRALPPLSDAQRKALAAIMLRIKQEGEKTPEAIAKRQAWKDKRRQDLIARGVSPERAERAVSAAVERHSLEGDFLIHLDDGSAVTVREILAKLMAFHRKTCADPLEPEYGGGRNKAIIFADGSPVRIFSHAHGGIEYCLTPDVTDYIYPVSAGADEWPEPIDVFGDGDPSALADIPPGALPIIVDDYARDVAERMGAPVSFAAVGAVVVASATIGGAIRLQPKALDSAWTVPAFLWALLVEEPGGKKSPVMSAVVTPLEKLDEQRAKQDAPLRQAWDAQKRKGAPPAGPRPPLRRSVVDSFTTEALRDILEENPKGVHVSADEITGLLGSLDQYKQKGSGSDRADLLKLMDGQPRTFDRVGRVWRVPCWGASVLGGIQPKKMAEMAKSLDPDGLLQRFIPVMGDGVRRLGVDRAPDSKAIDAYHRAITGLADLPAALMGSVVQLSPEAQRIRARFEQRLEALMDVPQASPAWSGHLNKWPGFFARLLLVFHMLDHWQLRSGDPTAVPVDAQTAERTYRFGSFLVAHAMRFYETVVGLGASGDAARKAAGIILVNEGNATLSRRDLYEAHREWRPGDRSPGELFDAMRILVRLGWCRPVANGERDPDRWEINPLVRARFQQRARAEIRRRNAEYQRVQAAAEERRELRRELSSGVTK